MCSCNAFVWCVHVSARWHGVQPESESQLWGSDLRLKLVKRFQTLQFHQSLLCLWKCAKEHEYSTRMVNKFLAFTHRGDSWWMKVRYALQVSAGNIFIPSFFSSLPDSPGKRAVRVASSAASSALALIKRLHASPVPLSAPALRNRICALVLVHYKWKQTYVFKHHYRGRGRGLKTNTHYYLLWFIIYIHIYIYI